MARAATKLEETGEQALDAALLLTTVFEMLGFSARAAGVRLSVDMPPLEIADNGPGIPPDVEARIIMRSLVQEMGGTIHLGSAPRRGTALSAELSYGARRTGSESRGPPARSVRDVTGSEPRERCSGRR